MTTIPAQVHITNSPDETRRLAADLVRQVGPGSVIALIGELGAGKTCFVQGVADALGVTGPVNSPTFTLINEYRGDHPIAHFDLYRLHQPDELLQLGWEEYLDDPDILTLVEWADRATDLMPPSAWRITIEHGEEEHQRRILVHPGSVS